MSDNFTRNRAFIFQDLIAASQRPHIYLDPCTSQGGILGLPFCWSRNALSIPQEEWQLMGELNIRSMQPLLHANGGTEGITISVFAWAEDVSLSIPTANEPGALSPQAGPDEYGTGPISRPAGIVAKVAGSLSTIPSIAPYARATQLAASTVSSVAQMFGYSRPAILDDIIPFRPTFVGNMANTNMPDSTTKLTFDAKQELTVDPRVAGLGSMDEMTVKAIACRESFLTSFSWPVSAPAETLLFNSEVSPVLWDEYPSTQYEYHFPASAFATLPFKAWRGSMNFRFQVVASAYHKGRLKITYDPSFPLTNEYNTNYTHIVDIAHDNDFTINVGWGATRSMLEYRVPALNSIPFGTSPLGSVPDLYGNGIISVYVVNEVSTPSSSTDPIAVNVFISMGEDFEVFEPTSQSIADFSYFPVPAESFESQMGEIDDSQGNAPLTEGADVAKAPTLDVNDGTLMVYYGDPIVSLRQCMKRYNYHSTYVPLESGATFFRMNIPNFPVLRGYNPNGLWNTATSLQYNYVQNTLMDYITPAFVVRRGGIRWKHVRAGPCCSTDIMTVIRDTCDCTGSFVSFPRSTVSTSMESRTRENNLALTHTWSGSHSTAVAQNPVLEVEIPWYSHERFAMAKTNATGSRHRLEGSWNVLEDSYPLIQSHVATGEDFSLSFFCGCPVIFVLPVAGDPPAAF